MKRTFLLSLMLMVLVFSASGCARRKIDRHHIANQIATPVGLIKALIGTDFFLLTGYTRFRDPTKPLRIYIEGDGFAFSSRTRISSNPTPKNPLALRLAALDPSANLVYLARPCQYTNFDKSLSCRHAYWSSKRFAEEVVSSLNQAIDHVKEQAGVQKIELVGYSGGGALVILIAARRDDVENIRTIGGNLDHVAVNRHHNAKQQTGSLNAIDVADQVKHIPQYHFAGHKDRIVPPFITRRFVERARNGNCVQMMTVRNVGHVKGWQKHWLALLEKKPHC